MDTFSHYKSGINCLPDFRHEPDLTADLISKMKARDITAKAKLIESTLNYIFQLAQAHCRREQAEAHLLDLVQEANRRVSAQIHRFNPQKASLKTFIYLCSSTAFFEYSSKTGIVSFTRHRRRMGRYVRYAFLQLSEQLGREPTDEELSEYLGIAQAKVRELRSSSAINIVELDAPAGEGVRANLAIDDGLSSPSKGSNSDSLSKSAEGTQLYEFAVECLGKAEADLWRTYKEGNTEFFYELYFKLTGKGKVAARAFIYRRNKKLKKYVQKKIKLSTQRGNYEFPATCSG